MIPKPIKEIDHDALRALIENEVSEGKTIEYKRELRGLFDKTDKKLADKHVESFLATVSAFANTAGGDLLIGVEEDNGVPTGLPGIEIDDPDKERLRLGQILRDNLEPRLPHFDIEPISLSNGRYVLVIRAPQSWNSPHRVNKNNRFYARHSAQSVPLDVGELRSAFTLSETVADRIRNFRTDRIAKIYGGETPVPLEEGGFMILHVLPLISFMGKTNIDIAAYKNSNNCLEPIIGSAKSDRINLDGLVTAQAEPGKLSSSYTQMFRTGVVEALIRVGFLDDSNKFNSSIYEQQVATFLKNYFRFAIEFEIEPPYYVFLSFLGVRGYDLTDPMDEYRVLPEDKWPLREDTLILPEVMIQDRDSPPEQALKPIFDVMWNAFGRIRSSDSDDQNS